jgi:hypothetical protein
MLVRNYENGLMKEMKLMHETEDLIRRLHVPEKVFEATMG